MSEAFKRHIPIWIFLVVALVITVVLIKIIDSRQIPEPAPTSTDTTSGVTPLNLEDISLRYVVGGLSAPTDIVSSGLDGDQRLFVAEQIGKIRILDQATGKLSAKVFLDISSRVINEGEMGLLGFTFDPRLSSRPFVYVNYVHPTATGRETIIARYELNADQTKADASSEVVLLRINQTYTNHNAGDLAFGPDGFLYVPLGDGGSSGDPQNRAQNPGVMLGKILRLDVSKGNKYSVPDGNPFIDDEDYLPEIWSLGWRNPWRISFDRTSGDMWVGDVGQNAAEEINHEPAATPGRNYGWRCFEAARDYNKTGCQNKSEYTFPVAQYSHVKDSCNSITGGFVYRGQQYKQLDGYYFYADYCTGNLYTLNSEEATFTARLFKNTSLNISTFGESSSGELFLADAKSGTIYQLIVD